MTLHTVSRSPFERNSLDTCLRLARPGSVILLIEDAVYAAARETAFAERMIEAMTAHAVYVLKPDLDARGIGTGRLLDGVRTVDYEGFVRLAAESDRIQSWL